MKNRSSYNKTMEDSKFTYSCMSYLLLRIFVSVDDIFRNVHCVYENTLSERGRNLKKRQFLLSRTVVKETIHKT